MLGLAWGRLGSILVGTILLSISVALRNGSSGTISTGTAVPIGTSLSLLLVGLGLGIAAAVVRQNAMGVWYDAMNTYHRELIDGRLGP